MGFVLDRSRASHRTWSRGWRLCILGLSHTLCCVTVRYVSKLWHWSMCFEKGLLASMWDHVLLGVARGLESADDGFVACGWLSRVDVKPLVPVITLLITRSWIT